MKRENKPTGNHYVLLTLSVFVLLISMLSVVFLIWVSRNAPSEVISVPISVSVASGSAFDLNSTSLTFGRIMPGNSVLRTISVNNRYDFPVVALFSTEGKDVGSFFYFIDKELISSKSTANISVSAIIPINASYGNYSGSFIIKIFKTKK